MKKINKKNKNLNDNNNVQQNNNKKNDDNQILFKYLDYIFDFGIFANFSKDHK